MTGRRLDFGLCELNKAVFFDTNPIGMKYMMKRLGIIPQNEHRLPMIKAEPDLETPGSGPGTDRDALRPPCDALHRGDVRCLPKVLGRRLDGSLLVQFGMREKGAAADRKP